MGLRFVNTIQQGMVTLKFDGKPSANIRGILKRNHFSWSQGNGWWWTRQVIGSADFIGNLSIAIDREEGVRRPVGKCWECKADEGFFRPHGAATPVYCDECHRKHLQADEDRQRGDVGDISDMLYEDSCRNTCGL